MTQLSDDLRAILAEPPKADDLEQSLAWLGRLASVAREGGGFHGSSITVILGMARLSTGHRIGLSADQIVEVSARVTSIVGSADAVPVVVEKPMVVTSIPSELDPKISTLDEVVSTVNMIIQNMRTAL